MELKFTKLISCLICLTVFFFGFTSDAYSGRKFALVIGINAYPNMPLEASVNDAGAAITRVNASFTPVTAGVIVAVPAEP